MSAQPPNLVLVSEPPETELQNRTTIVHVLDGRRSVVKLAPVIAALEHRTAFEQVVIHVSHMDERAMIEKVLTDLEVPAPAHFVAMAGESHGARTAGVLRDVEELLAQHAPMLVLLAGDADSTLACALAASKLGIAVAHLEAGLRNFDWSLAAEVNRVLTDRLADILFTHSPEATDNLKAEGIGPGRVYVTGNTLVDTVRRSEKRAVARATWKDLGLKERAYVLVTLHKAVNVDPRARLHALVESLERLAVDTAVVFPIHPRTRSRLVDSGGLERLQSAGVVCLEPLSYLDFLSLEAGARAIVTDSSGVQEEASALGVSCFTVRATSERPVTLTHGTNVLLGDDPWEIARLAPAPHAPTPSAIPLWDGRACERVAIALEANYAVTPGVAGAGV
jgi:UDP-N-acetylglucosamine 2-epimerase (non-hydrolysing)